MQRCECQRYGQEPTLSPGLWLAWIQAHGRNWLPHTLKAVNGLKGSRKSCSIPVLADSGRGRVDEGGSGQNTSRGALWADTTDWLGKLCPAFGNHTEAKEMEFPEQCKMDRCVVLFQRCLPSLIVGSVLMHKMEWDAILTVPLVP